MVSLRPRAFVLAVVATVAGCGSILGIPSSDDEGTPDAGGGSSGTTHGGGTTGPASGEGGEAGEGGTSGSSGTSNGGRGGSTGGSPSTGGRSTGGAGTTTGGAGGEPSDGGAGTTGAPDWAREGEPCATSGALACVEPASDHRLVCNGREWQRADCLPNPSNIATLCDRRTGTCGTQLCGDRPGTPSRCSSILPHILVCGPDFVTWEKVDCVFGCNGESECMLPGLDQFVIHEPFDGGRKYPQWPSPLISVCWTEPYDEALADARDAIRFAVDSTWGRPTAVGFTGWDRCPSGQARVELRFVDDCRGELARMPRIGYPGPGQSVSIELCKSYYDTANVSVLAPDDLLRHVAMHMLGHALGLEDAGYQRGTADVMMQALDVPGYPASRLGVSAVESLRMTYGGKPPRSLVTPDGQCLSLNGGYFAVVPCNGESSQGWDLLPDGTLYHPNSFACLRSGAAGSVEFVSNCEPDRSRDARLSDRVRWVTFGDQCVTLDEPFRWPIATAPCQPGQHDPQSFAFEFGASSVRIRAPNGHCVLPLEPAPGSQPSLAPCDGLTEDSSDDFFEAFAGRLGRRGYFLTRGYPGLGFERGDTPEKQDFWISGAFLLGDSDALTLTYDENGTPTLSTTPYQASPLPSQTFDYHF